MNMTDVISITIPQGTVKKIEDSNGNMIWGSASAYPYRRLEYIQGTNMISGIDTFVSPVLNNSRLLIRVENIDNNGSGQQGRGSLSPAQRFAVGFSKDGDNPAYFGGLGANWNGTWNAGWPSYTSGIHNLAVHGSSYDLTSFNYSGTKYAKGYMIDNTWVSVSNTVTNGKPYYSLFLLGSRQNINDKIGQGQLSCKLYFAEINTANATSATRYYTYRFYPVQRKSDNKIGLMKITYSNQNGWTTQENSQFLTTNTEETGVVTAGPTVDEYWDYQSLTY